MSEVAIDSGQIHHLYCRLNSGLTAIAVSASDLTDFGLWRWGLTCPDTAAVFKTGAVFKDHFFQHEMEVIAKAMELITAFNAAGIINQKGEPYFSLVFPAPSYLHPMITPSGMHWIQSLLLLRLTLFRNQPQVLNPLVNQVAGCLCSVPEPAASVGMAAWNDLLRREGDGRTFSGRFP